MRNLFIFLNVFLVASLMGSATSNGKDLRTTWEKTSDIENPIFGNKARRGTADGKGVMCQSFGVWFDYGRAFAIERISGVVSHRTMSSYNERTPNVLIWNDPVGGGFNGVRMKLSRKLLILKRYSEIHYPPTQCKLVKTQKELFDLVEQVDDASQDNKI
jgi:hypothetical protein